MLRKLALSLAVAGALATTQVNALGLGNITVKSALNEPLDAEIQLLQVRDLNPLQIKPSMANEDEFALAGVSQQRALSDIRFQVKVNPNGTGVILLTSRRPVKEPFMNFLVEVNWPSGRLVREYTLLLDPPVFDPTPNRTLVQPANTVAASAQAKQPSRQPAGPRQTKTETYVDSKDTLWEIAIRHRAAPDISSYQMMIALQKKNPQAFPDGNINNLKAGVTMTLPSAAEARALSSTQALQEVRRQTVAWKARSRSSSEAPKTTIDGSKQNLKTPAAASEPVGEADNAQLKVVAPEEQTAKEDAAPADQTEASSESTALQSENQKLQDQLAVSLESIDRLERDNADLSSKLDAIQQQLDSLQRLIELKDQQMAALQNELQQRDQVIAKTQAENEKSWLDKVLEYPEYLLGLGGGLLAALVGVWLLLSRRRRQQQEAAEEAEFMAQNSAGAVALPADDELDASLESLDQQLAEAAEEEASQAVAEDLQASDLEQLNDLDNLDELDNLDDLNLDMDLDLDQSSMDAELDALALESEATPDEADDLDAILQQGDESLADDEFDLGIDEIDKELAELDAGAVPAEESIDEIALDSSDIDTSLDDLLEMGDEDTPITPDRGLGTIPPLDSSDDTDDTLASLGLESLQDLDDLEALAPQERDDDALLDSLTSVPEQSDGEEDLLAELDNLDGFDDDLAFTRDDSVDDLSDVDELDGLDDSHDLDAQLDDALDFAVADTATEAAVEKPELDSALNDLDELDFALADISDLEQPTALDDTVDADTAVQDEALADGLEAILDGVDDEQQATSFASVDMAPADSADMVNDLDLDEQLLAGGDALDEVDELPASLDELADADGAELLELESELDGIAANADVSDLDQAGTALDQSTPGQDSLSASIEHDLDTELNDELEALLGSTDNDIALEESGEVDERPLDGMNLLDGADEVETKLDLARAYIDMDDADGARDILQEVIHEGSEAQKAEANSLLETLS